MNSYEHTSRDFLPLSVIRSACAGDTDAVEQVLRHYRGYINKLCTGIMLSTLSTMIAVVLAFLILYANQFLLKRRKKELGVYMMYHGICPHETLISSTFKV